MESSEILTLRAMAWQRAKGELNAMLATFEPASGSVGAGGPEQAAEHMHEVQQEVRSFIDRVETRL